MIQCMNVLMSPPLMRRSATLVFLDNHCMMSSSRDNKSEYLIAAANAAAAAAIGRRTLPRACRTTSPAPAPPSDTQISVDEPVPPARRARGRPPGSVADKFITHELTVNTGEDVYHTIWSAREDRRAVCIVSATGFISKVRFQRSAGTEDFEGQFYIVSMSGSVMPQDVAGGGITIALTANDGRVFGGAVAGLLTAASDVHVVLGSFKLTANNMLRI